MTRYRFNWIHVLGIQMLLVTAALVGLAQQQKKEEAPASREPTDVVRISTELVQTDVMVFDKKGRFVEGLQPEQFELQVNGKRQPISFFESVRAGSEREAAQLRAASTGESPQSLEGAAINSTSVRGRTLLFYVDDLHISPGSISRVRKTLLNFIDNKLGENDQVAITSATGRIGFLQQLTDNKAVLRAAVDRITYAAAMGQDHENPPMSEYAAILIAERRDRLLFDYFVEQTVKVTKMPPEIAGPIVERRSKAIVRDSAATNKLTLLTLGNLMQSLIKVPGRKLVFFISDGFVPNYSGSDIADSLHRATDAAAAAGVVIYSIDAKGLATHSSLDASSGGGFDPTGILQSRLGPELSAAQEPLHAVATATGGRALVNTNALNDSIDKGLNETSNYYLLAWRPEGEGNRSPKSAKVKVSITGRPDLEVKLRRGYLGTSTQPVKAKGKVAETENEMLAASVIGSSEHSPTREELATSLFVGYKRSGSDTVQLVAFIEVAETDQASSETSQSSEGQVVGVVFDSKGKPVGSFRRAIAIPKTQGRYASSNYEKNLPEGLYQVRVFARDRKSERLGFAHQWIEIPRFKTGQLSMSSLYLGEITDGVGSSANESRNVSTSASRRFARAASLRFTTYIYDSAPSPTAPELSIQTRILRGGQPITTAEGKVPVSGVSGFATIPYSAQFSLNKMPPGRYRLEVKVTNQKTKSSATQHTDFTVY